MHAESSGSKATYVVIVVFDIAESVLSYRGMRKNIVQIRTLQQKIYRMSTRQSLLDQLVSLSQEPNVFLDPKVSTSIRFRSSIEHRMSVQGIRRLSSIAAESIAEFKDQLDILEKQRSIGQRMSDSISRVVVSPKASFIVRFSTRVAPVETKPRRENYSLVPQIVQNALVQPTQGPRREMADAALADKRELMRAALKLLFKCEYHTLVEFVKFAVSVMYAIYVLVLNQLPSAQYYPEMRDMATDQAYTMVLGILAYSFYEGLSLLAMRYAVKWCCGVSPVHLLGFVVKNQSKEFQGRLLACYAYVLQLTLDHFGTSQTACLQCLGPNAD